MPLTISIILFFLVGVFGISKINAIRATIKSTQKDQATLTQKLNLLHTLSQTAVLGTGVVNSALPEGNSVLSVISQLKLLASANGITFSNIKSGVPTINELGLKEAVISFTLEGAKSQIISFLTNISGFSPIVVLNKIVISENSTGTDAQVTARSFWSPLPATIPFVTQAISDLTNTEKETLAKIANLTQPVFIEATQSGSAVNPNPFGL